MATRQESKSEIRATREEWEAAMNRWYNSYRRGEHGRDLLERQYPLHFKLKENIKSLNGEPIVIFKGPEGHVYNKYAYRGMILNAKELGGIFTLTVFLSPNEMENWEGERVETVQLFQIDAVRKIFGITDEQRKEMKFFNLLNTLNLKRNENVIKIERDIRTYKESMMSMQRDIERYEKKLTELEDILKKTKVDNVTLEGMLDSFRQLGKNKKVFNAYVRDDSKMVVETEMLYAISKKTNKEDRRKKVGRLAFELSTQGIDYCKFTNLDYCYHSVEYRGSHYYLPNVKDQGICYGDNGTLMSDLVKSGNFYELVDFLILFFSLFPHDSGAPFINHGQWMKGRVRELKTNPFNVATNRKLWELYPGKVYAQSDEERKALMFAELEDFATNMGQRVAPVRNPLAWAWAAPNPEPTPIEVPTITLDDINRYEETVIRGNFETPTNIEVTTDETTEPEAPRDPDELVF